MTSQPLSAPSTLSFHNVFRGCHCPELLRFNIFFLKKSQVGGMSRVLKAQHLWLLRGYTTLLVTITNRPEMVPAELSEAAPRMILPCSGIGQLASMQWMASYCCWKTKMGTHPFWMHKAGHASSPDAQCWAHIHVACMCCSPWLSAHGWDAMGMWPRWPPWQQRSWQQTVGHITGHEVFCSAVDFSTGEQDWALLGCWEEKRCWGAGVCGWGLTGTKGRERNSGNMFWKVCPGFAKGWLVEPEKGLETPVPDGVGSARLPPLCCKAGRHPRRCDRHLAGGGWSFPKPSLVPKSSVWSEKPNCEGFHGRG